MNCSHLDQQSEIHQLGGCDQNGRGRVGKSAVQKLAHNAMQVRQPSMRQRRAAMHNALFLIRPKLDACLTIATEIATDERRPITGVKAR